MLGKKSVHTWRRARPGTALQGTSRREGCEGKPRDPAGGPGAFELMEAFRGPREAGEQAEGAWYLFVVLKIIIILILRASSCCVAQASMELFFSFLAVLGFELRALNWLGRHSAT